MCLPDQRMVGRGLAPLAVQVRLTTSPTTSLSSPLSTSSLSGARMRSSWREVWRGGTRAVLEASQVRTLLARLRVRLGRVSRETVWPPVAELKYYIEPPGHQTSGKISLLVARV